jgi:hypothetical protein
MPYSNYVYNGTASITVDFLFLFVSLIFTGHAYICIYNVVHRCYNLASHQTQEAIAARIISYYEIGS